MFHFLTWVRRQLRAVTGAKAPAARSNRPRLENLEDRTAPAVLTWTGEGRNDNMSTAANWNLRRAPRGGDILIFGADADSSNAVNNFRSLTVGGLVFADSGYTLSGRGITVRGTVAATANAAGGTNTIAAPLILPQAVTFNLASDTEVVVSGRLRSFNTRTPLVKTGEGKLTLGGTISNDLRAKTVVNGGTLELSKVGVAVALNRNVQINSGTVMLGASGQFSAAAGIGAASAGTFDTNGHDTEAVNLLMTPGSTYAVNVSGTLIDQVDVPGAVRLNGATFAPHGNFTGNPPVVIPMIDNGGSDAVVGTFAGLAEGARLSVGGNRYMISYVGGSGNDVVLTRDNSTPGISSNGGGDVVQVNVAENQTAVTTVQATDPDLADSVVYTVAGGADASLFAIDPITGRLEFLSAPNFERPTDADVDNVYYVSVRATDPLGAADEQLMLVTVGNVDEPPVAFDDAFSGGEDTPIAGTVLGNDAHEDGGPITVGTVNGDASNVGAPVAVVGGSVTVLADGSFAFTPDANFTGNSSFAYTATDGTLGSNVAVVALAVTPLNDSPLAADDVGNGQEDSGNVAGNVLTNDFDPEGAGLTVASVNGETTTVGVPVAVVGGSVTVLANGTYTFTPDVNFNGNTSFTYTATDGNLASNVAVVRIAIAAVNDVPVAQAQAFDTNEDTARNGTLTAADIDGDALTFKIGALAAEHGTVTINANGTFTYTPDLNYSGTDRFSFVANDGTIDSAAAVVTVNVIAVNDAPVAVDLNTSTNEDTALSGQLTGSDPVESSPVTFVAVANPTNGAVTVNADGTFTYTPNANFYGTDTFTFRVNDGAANSTVATVTIAVNSVNDAPVLAPASFQTNEDVALNNQVVATDVELNAIGYRAGPLAPANGTVVVNPDGTFTYTPNADFNGTDSFSVIPTDGVTDGAAATVTVTVNPVNDAPVAADTEFTIDEDTVLPGMVSATDIDTPVSSLRFLLDEAPEHGTVALNPDGTFTYTPDADYNGTDSFTFVVNDGSADSAPATVLINITPVNDAPRPTDDTFEGDEDVEVTGNVLDNDVDPENDGLTVVAVNGSDTALGTPLEIDGGTLTVNADGSFVFTPNAQFSGEVTFTYSLRDGELIGDPATVTLTLNAVDDAPAFTSPDAVNVDENTTAAGTVTASDVDSSGLTYSIDGGADGALFAIDETTGALAFVAAPDFEGPTDADADNVYEVSVAVTDGTTTVSQLIRVTVINVVE